MRNLFTYIVASSIISAPAEEKLFERLDQMQRDLYSTGKDQMIHTKGIYHLVQNIDSSSLDSKIVLDQAWGYIGLLENAIGRKEQEQYLSNVCFILKNLAANFRYATYVCPVTNKIWITKTNIVNNPYLQKKDSAKRIS
ncbi:hypothetical protein [Leptospira sp. 'Mane']|uniref:hypothetical protein n=1 Tax=Leptospira sp. 'Mane' TaxID=3387407 RepID=UPI00398B4FC4